MEGKEGQTEPATAKRRQEAREEGNLCISQEVITMLVLFFGVLCVYWSLPALNAKLTIFFNQVMTVHVGAPWDVSMVQQWHTKGMIFLMVVLAPIVVPLTIAGIGANIMQTGWYFSWKALKVRFSALNPINGLKQLVSIQSLVTLGLSSLKICLILFVFYLVLRNKVPQILSLYSLPVDALGAWISQLLFRMTMTVVVLFVIIAAIDWAYRKYTYERGLMMTRKQVEDERKSTEPPAIVRGAMRRKMRELTLSRMMAAVPKATVVVTNPTHVAVALEYSPASMGAPKVTAKGLRLVAERIKRIARENNVPILERPALARDLYKNVKVGREIPSRFYGAIAELLAYLYRLGEGRVRATLSKRAEEVG